MTDSGTKQVPLVENHDDLEPAAVEQWVVVANFPNDPHPHVLGTFRERDEAEELKADCRAVTRGPHPSAWTLWRLVANKEPEQISP